MVNRFGEFGRPCSTRTGRPTACLISCFRHWSCQITSNTLTASSHALRYVLKNRATNDVLLVIIFTLLPKEEGEKKDESDGDEEYASANEQDDELD